MVASTYYTPEPDPTTNTSVDPVMEAPMVVGNPALSRREPKRQNKTALMVGIPVAAVLIVGLGAAVMMADKGSSPGSTTTQTSQTTTASTMPAPAPVPAPVAAAPVAPTPVQAAANTMDATPPVTQSASPTPAHHAVTRHLASRSARSGAAPSAADASTSGADVSATVPVNPPAASAPTTPPVVSAPPPAVTAQPSAGQSVNPAPDATTTQP